MRCGSFPAAGELSNNPLRLQLTAEPKVLSEVLAVVQRGISTFLIQRSGLTVASGARTGAVTLIQRFGSALNLNPHLGNCSCVALPPASLQSCTCCSWTGPIRFAGAGLYFTAPGSQREDIVRLLHGLSGRIVHLLERLCRYITRPPVATKRLSVDARGWVVHHNEQPFRHCLTHLLLAMN